MTTSGRLPSACRPRLRVQGRPERLVGRELRAARRAQQPQQRATGARAPGDRSSSTTTTRATGSPTTAARSSRSRRAASRASWAAEATGTRAACARGCRTSTATARTRSRRPRCPQGSYETKVAINESWDENYGPNGEPNSPTNIGFSVPADNAKVTMSYDSVTHVLSITVAADHGAPGGPGALSHFDLARKDCLGTARNRTSKVWYTVAGGMLSDVYYPTVDNTNVETLQYIVSDGSTFTDLQARDMTYTVAAIADTGGMACRVTASANRGTYQIVTDYITDPARNTLLMHVTFVPESNGLQLYVRFDPTVNGNGGGGSGNGGADSATVAGSADHPILVASDPVTATNAANRDYAQPVFAALDGTFTRGVDRLRRLRERRDRPARRVARPRDHVPRRTGRERRRDRPGRPRRRGQRRPRARVRRLAGRGRQRGARLARPELRQDAGCLQEGLEGLRRRPDPAEDGEAARDQWQGPEGARGDVLPERERAQGVGGQDVPRRDRRQPRVTMGSSGLGRRPGEHLLRVLPRGLRARPVRGVDRPDRRRRPGDGARRDAIPVRAPAARRRVVPAQQPGQRQDRTRLVRHAAGPGRLPDPDGGPARVDRSRPVRGPRQARRELPGRPRPCVRCRALGGAERLLAIDHRGRDRRAGRRGRSRPGER